MASNCYSCLYRIYKDRPRGTTNYCMQREEWIGYIHKCETYSEFIPQAVVYTIAGSSTEIRKSNSDDTAVFDRVFSTELAMPRVIDVKDGIPVLPGFESRQHTDSSAYFPGVVAVIITALVILFVYWFLMW